MWGGPTEDYRFGESIRQYLIRRGGFSPTEARDAWRLRQVLHGEDVKLTPTEVARLVDRVRVLVATELKGGLGRNADELPTIAEAPRWTARLIGMSVLPVDENEPKGDD